MSARFTDADSSSIVHGDDATRARAIPVRVELAQELGAALRLVGLADRLGGARAGRRAPGGTRGSSRGASARSPSRASPTGAAGRARGGSRRGSTRRPRRRRAPSCAEPRPRVEEARPARAHVGDRVAAALDRAGERGRAARRARRRARDRAPSRAVPPGVKLHVGHQRGIVRDRRAGIVGGHAPVDRGDRPTHRADRPTTPTAKRRRSTRPKPPTRARARAARRHRAHRSAALGPHARHRSVREGHRAGRGDRASGSRRCRSPRCTRARSSARRRPREHIAARHGLEVQPLPGVIEADYGDWTGGKIADLAKTDEWKVVQVAPSRARFPSGESLAEMQSRMVAALDAVVAAPPARDGRGREPRRSDQVGDRALHAACTSTCSSACTCRPASVTVFDFHAYGVMLVKCNDTGGLDDLAARARPAEPPSPSRGADVMTDAHRVRSGRRRSAPARSASPARARS